MKKRSIALLLCIVLIFVCFCGCKKKVAEVESSMEVSSEEPVPVNPNKINPFTGVQDLDPAYENRRPVAVMVNNKEIAQPVQTGLNRADIIFQTEVEGGITRLMAVFKNMESADRIGPIRSARYPYIDLAAGLEAAYIHCGTDPGYAGPHLNDIDDISVDANYQTQYYSERIPNGLDWEHTLYSYGNLLWQGVNDKGFNTTLESNEPWQNFAGEDEKISFDGTSANTVTVPFDEAETFTYDSSSGLYTRNTQGSVRCDYVTGEAVQVKNLFILNTTIVYYPDGVHRQVYLDGGSGWYVVNGTYTPITWRKGGTYDKMSFYTESGYPLTVNQGTSWVFLVNEGTTSPYFE